MVNTNNNGSLEDVVVASAPISSQNQEILPLDEYVNRFTDRYKQDEHFRYVVHDYLDLNLFRRASLAVSKKLAKSFYNKQTDKIIKQYAEKIREDLAKALEVKQELFELERKAIDLQNKAAYVEEVAGKKEEEEEAYANTIAKKDDSFIAIERDIGARKEDEAKRRSLEIDEIMKRSDAAELIKKHLRINITSSGLVKVDDNGDLVFNVNRIADKLGDIYLDEIVTEIEREDGKSGFLHSMKSVYDGLVSHNDFISDIAELPEVDWVESAIVSRQQGYRVPTFPYLVVAKHSKIGKAKVTMDSAMIVDTSGSMEENNRLQVAKKTILAYRALMMRLHPQNESFLAHYNNSVYPVTPGELLQSVGAGGGTATHLALDWLLETLKDRGLSIATLVTDGAPNDVGHAIKAAQKFRDYPYILLRIFLVDGNAETEDNIRKIGMSAGSRTKVSNVNNYMLAGGVIRDVSDAMGQMYNIGAF